MPFFFLVAGHYNWTAEVDSNSWVGVNYIHVDLYCGQCDDPIVYLIGVK